MKASLLRTIQSPYRIRNVKTDRGLTQVVIQSHMNSGGIRAYELSQKYSVTGNY